MNEEIRQLWVKIQTHLDQTGQQIMLDLYPELREESGVINHAFRGAECDNLTDEDIEKLVLQVPC